MSVPTKEANPIDVIIHNLGEENTSIEVSGINSAKMAEVNLAVRKAVGKAEADSTSKFKIDVDAKNALGTIKIRNPEQGSGFTYSPGQPNSAGTIAAGIVVELVKAEQMDGIAGYNKLGELASRQAINFDAHVKALKDIGIKPELLGATEAPKPPQEAATPSPVIKPVSYEPTAMEKLVREVAKHR